MRHRLANNGLSRTTSHRMLMLRNLVSSLLQHEQVQTTVAKAKQAQRLADTVIQWGKNGTQSDKSRANLFLLNSSTTLSKLFTEYAQRYAARSGGYTRVVRAGFRQGDHAELAVLQLVDGPNDLKFEQAARAVGREMALRVRSLANIGPDGWRSFRTRIEQSSDPLTQLQNSPELERLTKQNVTKALAFRLEQGSVRPSVDKFLDRSYHHYLQQLAILSLSSRATPDPERTVKQLSSRLRPSESRGAPKQVVTVPLTGRLPKAGERTDGWHQNPSNKETASLETDSSRNIAVRGGPISVAKFDRSRTARRTAPRTVTSAQGTEAEPVIV
ncbi:54S ribosomal protein L8, mitochondrial [Microbotryomycetes sp. JL201]|nr:54S ribosomal protein L8, mitochondrial [Microbotryomycetes sp. JL201]